jgi:hypothetical protein
MPTRWFHLRRLRQRGRYFPGRVSGPFASVVDASQPCLVELTAQQLETATGSGGYLLL